VTLRPPSPTRPDPPASALADGERARAASGVDLGALSYHPHSFADPHARVRIGQGRIYRSVSARAADRFRALFDEGVVSTLVERRLFVESELLERRDGGDLVIRHRRIPFVAYPHEWPFRIFQSAALAMLDTALALTEFGRTLADGHPWNVVVDPTSCTPLFVDLGSFWPVRSPEWLAESEFVRFTFHPLGLMAAGKPALARMLMVEDEGVSADSLGAFARRERVREESASALADRSLERHRESIERLRSHAAAYRPPPAARPEPRRRDLEPADLESVLRVLDAHRAKSLLDLGPRPLGSAVELARHLPQVIALTAHEATADRLVEAALAERLPLLPLVIDPLRPTPARGVLDYWQIGATRRLRCDAVLAAETVGWVVDERRLTLEHAAATLAQFSPRVAIVVPPRGRRGGSPPIPTSEVSLALGRWFSRVESVFGAAGREPILVATEPRVDPISAPSPSA